MRQYCTSLYICFLVLIFPLYYQNNYINILEAKSAIYTIGTLCFGIAILMGIWYDSIRAYEAEQKLKKKNPAVREKYEKSWVTICFWIFVGMVVLSTIASGDMINAWHGWETKLFGTKMMLLCATAYLLTFGGCNVNKFVKYSMIVGLSAVCILAILNRFHIDVLHMYDNLLVTQKPKYVSTIGNINILSNYLCVFTPLAMGLYLYGKKKQDKILYGVLTILCVMAGIASNSDSFFLGFGGAIVVYLWFAMTSKAAVSTYLQMLILCGSGLWILKNLTRLCLKEVKWESIQLDLLEEIPWLLIIVVLVLVSLVMYKTDFDCRWDVWRRIVFGSLGLCILIAVVFVVRGNLGGVTGFPKSLIFDDSWGTNRGYVWRNTLVLFNELPLHQKIIGIGPGKFYDFFHEPNKLREIPFVDPHSDYLFYLVTTGLAGFTAWLGMIAAGIVSCWKKQTPETIVIVAVLISWMMQAMVNTSIVFTAPYLFVTLGISRWKTRKPLKK